MPTPPILDPFAIVSQDAKGEGVGSRPHDGPRPPSVRSSHPVSIEMPDSLIEELPRDVSRLASLVLHSARKQPRPRKLRRCRQTGGSTAMRDMTYLGEPQCAAGDSSLVPGGWADQPCLDGCSSRSNNNLQVDQSLFTFKSINLSLFNSVRRLSVFFWALA